jgi:hypothetical protein
MGGAYSNAAPTKARAHARAIRVIRRTSRGGEVHPFIRSSFALAAALWLGVLPSPASAEPGSGTDLYRINREVDAMMRDGRWQHLLNEGQANKQAFDRLRPSGSAPSANTVAPSTRPRRR